GPRIRDLKLPPDAVITLITRGRNVVLPKGNTHLKGWDQVTVLAHATDEPAVRAALLTPFEKREEPPEPPATPPDDAAKPPQDPAKPPEPSTKPPEAPAAEK